MSRPLTLSVSDIQEIISAFLTSEMDYQQKMNNLIDDKLESSFRPNKSMFADLDSILSRISEHFGLNEHAAMQQMTLKDMAEFVFSRANGNPAELTFFTSGSTGNPMPSKSSYSSLIQEIKALAELFPERKRIISFVPRHHIYGFLFSILLPKALDVPVLFKPALPTAQLIASLHPGDLVVAFPMLWSKLQKIDASFEDNILAVTSTGPCPASTIDRLKKMGLKRMTEVYGSSETGGVGYRHDPADFYTLLPYWKKIDAFSLSRKSSNNLDSIYNLQDALKWDGADRFVPLQRRDKAVQVGGINVYPSKVESFFNSLPEVQACSVRLMNPQQGDRLKIFIVPTGNIDQTEIEHLLRKKSATLKTAERPASYTFGAKLPLSAMGKLTDW